MIPSGFGGGDGFVGVSDDVVYDFWGVVPEHIQSVQVDGNTTVVTIEQEGGYPSNDAIFHVATGDDEPNTVCVAAISCGVVRFDICLPKSDGYSIRCVKDYNYADIL